MLNYISSRYTFSFARAWFGIPISGFTELKSLFPCNLRCIGANSFTLSSDYRPTYRIANSSFTVYIKVAFREQEFVITCLHEAIKTNLLSTSQLVSEILTFSSDVNKLILHCCVFLRYVDITSSRPDHRAMFFNIWLILCKTSFRLC